jgi:hypothetical protein
MNFAVYQELGELKTQLTLTSEAVARLTKANEGFEERFKELQRSVDGKKSLRTTLWTISLALGAFLGFVGWDFYQTAKETMADTLKSGKSELETYVAVDARKAIEQVVQKEIANRGVQFDHIQAIADHIRVDSQSGEFVILARQVRFERPRSATNSNSQGYFEFTFDAKVGQGPAMVVVDEGLTRFEGDFGNRPFMRLRTGPMSDMRGKIIPDTDEVLFLDPSSLTMRRMAWSSALPVDKTLTITSDGDTPFRIDSYQLLPTDKIVHINRMDLMLQEQMPELIYSWHKTKPPAGVPSRFSPGEGIESKFLKVVWK